VFEEAKIDQRHLLDFAKTNAMKTKRGCAELEMKFLKRNK